MRGQPIAKLDRGDQEQKEQDRRAEESFPSHDRFEIFFVRPIKLPKIGSPQDGQPSAFSCLRLPRPR